MSEVKRYCMDQTGCEIEDPTGVWVRADDHERDVQRAIAAGIRMQDKCAALEAENERLKGLLPEMPPRPPDGDGLPRYGQRWNGPAMPLSVPMDDGYWTPWHLADAIVAALRQPVADEQAAFEEWLARVCPSGDCEQVQAQWESSSDYADLREARAALSAPAAGQDVSGLVEALELMVTTHDEGGWPTATITIARAALAAHKAGEPLP